MELNMKLNDGKISHNYIESLASKSRYGNKIAK